jgi:hypothetical protein
MKRRELLMMLAGATAVRAQRNPTYDRSVVSQIRIDLRDLGYPPVDVIPPDDSAIRALAVAPDAVRQAGRRVISSSCIPSMDMCSH